MTTEDLLLAVPTTLLGLETVWPSELAWSLGPLSAAPAFISDVVNLVVIVKQRRKLFLETFTLRGVSAEARVGSERALMKAKGAGLEVVLMDSLEDW